MSEQEQPNGQAPTGGEGGQASAQSAEQFDVEYVRQLRAENAKWRTEAQAAKAKVTEFEAAQMTEAQKFQAQAQAAQAAAEATRQELRRLKVQAEIAKVAQKMGIDIDLAERIARPSWDGDTLTGIDESLQEALEKWPNLKPQAVTVAATNPGRTQKLTRADIDKMSIDEINNRWDEVQTVLAAGG